MRVPFGHPGLRSDSNRPHRLSTTGREELGSNQAALGGAAPDRYSRGLLARVQADTLRLIGRWMRMFTIPNQSSVPMAYKEFGEAGRMRQSAYYDRVVDVMEELFKITLLMRGRTEYLTDRYSERNERAVKAINKQIASL